MIVADRLPYNEAIATSWKEQTLLNIVKMRYNDTPFFVDVTQITSGYSRVNSANANVSFGSSFFPGAVFGERMGALLGGQTAFEERPTISYSPQTSAEFVRNLTNPIAPKSILFMIQSGYDAEFVFDLLVDSINGINNGSFIAGELREPDPRFHEFLQILKRAQQSGNVGMRIEQGKDTSETVVFFFRDKNISPETALELAEGRRLLGLKDELSEFKVVFGEVPKSNDELAIMTRSIFRMLGILSLSVEVPVCHLAEGRALDLGGQASPSGPAFIVHSSC